MRPSSIFFLAAIFALTTSALGASGGYYAFAAAYALVFVLALAVAVRSRKEGL